MVAGDLKASLRIGAKKSIHKISSNIILYTSPDVWFVQLKLQGYPPLILFAWSFSCHEEVIFGYNVSLAAVHRHSVLAIGYLSPIMGKLEKLIGVKFDPIRNRKSVHVFWVVATPHCNDDLNKINEHDELMTNSSKWMPMAMQNHHF